MDVEPTPPGGFPMRWAITALAEGEAGRVWVEAHEFEWRHQRKRAFEEAQRCLWHRLLERAWRGEVVFVGVKQGSDVPVRIVAALLRGSRPDYNADTLEVAGTTYYAVSVFRAGDQIAPVDATADAPEPPTHTGTAGRPSSADLAKLELARRADAGLLLPTLIGEARHLVAWLEREHHRRRGRNQSLYPAQFETTIMF